MTPGTRTSNKAAPFAYACPHLGMLDDTTTTTTFPSEVNHCLHCKPACVPSSQHQSAYCLSQQYTNCPIIHQPAPARLPAHLRWARDPVEFKSIFIKTALIVFATGMLAMFFVLGAPARISKMIQAFVPDTTLEAYQPVNFATRTATPSGDARGPYPTSTTFFSSIQIPTAIPFAQIVKLTVIELEMGAYCRSGPDVTFRGVTILKTGDILQAIARNTANTYYYVRVPNQIVEDCWVAQPFVKVQGDQDTLPMYTSMPTPWPTRTPTAVPPTATETHAPSVPQPNPTYKPTSRPATDVPVIPTEPPPTKEPTSPPAEPTLPPEPTDPPSG